MIDPELDRIARKTGFDSDTVMLVRLEMGNWGDTEMVCIMANRTHLSPFTVAEDMKKAIARWCDKDDE